MNCVCFVGRTWQSMKERYRKVPSWKLEEYLPSDVVIPMQEADLEGKPPPPFLFLRERERLCVCVCMCVCDVKI